MKPKRSKEWLLAKELYEVGMAVKYPIKERYAGTKQRAAKAAAEKEPVAP